MTDTVELKEELLRFAMHETLAKELWGKGKIIYQRVPITLTDSFRREVEANSGLARVRLLFLHLDHAQPLLKLFPNLKVVFEDTTGQIRLHDFVYDSTPAFVYCSNTRTLSVSPKATLEEGVFSHELGHHVVAFFQTSDWLTMLASRSWKINEKGRCRDAVIDDLKTLEELQNTEGVSIDEIPDWAYMSPSGERGKRYRHSSPFEMVAEVFADHDDEILSLIRENRLKGKEGRRTVTRYILGKLTK